MTSAVELARVWLILLVSSPVESVFLAQALLQIKEAACISADTLAHRQLAAVRLAHDLHILWHQGGM